MTGHLRKTSVVMPLDGSVQSFRMNFNSKRFINWYFGELLLNHLSFGCNTTGEKVLLAALVKPQKDVRKVDRLFGHTWTSLSQTKRTSSSLKAFPKRTTCSCFSPARRDSRRPRHAVCARVSCGASRKPRAEAT